MENKEAVVRLAALAQDTRLAIFRLLVTAGPEGMVAGRIGEQLALAPATLSFHLKALAQAGLIEARHESRFIHYSVNYPAMNALLAFLTDSCCGGAPCEITAPSCCTPSEQA
ncbi:ArsR/SmtB family transcription factor [Jeongeupia naejangsanensis]|uniref:Helix-turn-helix transcriptional regulator n=1 Tax=Jeongeupia naejangsanensis TaxID=613195 RepID=A0ABS2BJX8_9NEIS|nr:metalloregulator ArsR/SmtB family transcription factor [Jeongeupia naejangsanensis]MBM3115920.1 helix-turn-helix transcriptional regulator [Jeongeupia naejangsanensis]